MANIATKIRHAFKTKPIISNCLFYGGVCVTSEIMKQTIFQKILPKELEPPYQTGSIVSVGLLGACAIGPAMYYWYKWLDRTFPGTAQKTIFRKVVLDHIVMNPYTYIFIMFWVVMSSEIAKQQHNLSDLSEKLDKVILPSYLIDSCFWLPAQAVNFGYYAPHQRVVFIGMCLLAWNVLKLGILVATLE